MSELEPRLTMSCNCRINPSCVNVNETMSKLQRASVEMRRCAYPTVAYAAATGLLLRAPTLSSLA